MSLHAVSKITDTGLYRKTLISTSDYYINEWDFLICNFCRGGQALCMTIEIDRSFYMRKMRMFK